MIELSEKITLPSGREKSMFDTAIPGQSLTKAPKSYPWESPPRMTTADEAMDYYFNRFDDEEVLFNLFALLEAKVPVAKIVDTMLLHGFSEGLYTPEIAILIAEDLMMTLALIAEQADIEYDLGAPEKSKNALKKAADLKEAIKEREDMFMPKVEAKLDEIREKRDGKGLMGPRETE